MESFAFQQVGITRPEVTRVPVAVYGVTKSKSIEYKSIQGIQKSEYLTGILKEYLRDLKSV